MSERNDGVLTKRRGFELVASDRDEDATGGPAVATVGCTPGIPASIARNELDLALVVDMVGVEAGEACELNFVVVVANRARLQRRSGLQSRFQKEEEREQLM